MNMNEPKVESTVEADEEASGVELLDFLLADTELRELLSEECL